ncbi:MAG: ATP-binding cassette domain-containing protein [bacterium]|nr:ATP-binding cassette domain-containing protein [bacterium]
MEIEKNYLAEIVNAVPRLPELAFTEPVNWTIQAGEQWAVIGPNGAGKSLLIDLLQRKFALKTGAVNFASNGRVSDFVRCITFKDIYSLADCQNTYYQQRWHATENDEVPRAAELLGVTPEEGIKNEELIDLFGIRELLTKKIIYLSSGELRKFLIVRALLKHPRLLILDNPFIGLDAPSRALLVEMLQQMTQVHGVQVILLLSNPQDIPAMVNRVLPVVDRTLLPPMSREAFLADNILIHSLFPTEGLTEEQPVEVSALPVDPEKQPATHTVTLRMEKVKVHYGSRTILQDIDWEIKNGEKWALFGPNGSGKSTLLSLVYADNPQSYANTLYLFDKKRGSGESIWDIKKRIGYVSPEMHLYYRQNVSTLKIVGSGFFDSIGLYQQCSEEQETLALAWMRLFGIDHLRDRMFQTLSSGEQRLVLLARAFVKDPDLIILDEPLHGLDVSHKKQAAAIIEQFCERPGKTLIYVTHYPHELPACVDHHFELMKH